MANALKCDRCGQYYDPLTKVAGIYEIYETVTKAGLYKSEKRDLCMECQMELAKWFKIER